MQAACLGLGEEAGKLLAARARDINKGAMFPAFWGPNYDWVPDQDHGSNILSTLQLMLLQYDTAAPPDFSGKSGGKIFLLPAWPKDWNASFKLHAPAKYHGRGRGARRETDIAQSDPAIPCGGCGQSVTALMEAPRLSWAIRECTMAPWMAIGAVAVGPGTLAIKAMSNLVVRVPRVISLARPCIMPVAVALPRATARAGGRVTIWALAVPGRRFLDFAPFLVLPTRVAAAVVAGAAAAVPAARVS